MKFKIGDKIIDPNETPCAIIFDNYDEKQKASQVISDIKAHEIIVEGSSFFKAANEQDFYWFSIHPKGMFTTETFDEWATIKNETNEIKNNS